MNDLDLIETNRLVLSGWRADQIEDLVRLHGDPVVARLLTRLKPGGALLLTVPANPWMWSAHDVAHHHHRVAERRMLNQPRLDPAGFQT